MVVWVTGLIFLGAFDSEVTPCAAWQALRARSHLLPLLLDSSPSVLVVHDDDSLEPPGDDEDGFLTFLALGGSSRPRFDERSYAPWCSTAPMPASVVRFPTLPPRPIGVSLIYAFCSLLI